MVAYIAYTECASRYHSWKNVSVNAMDSICFPNEYENEQDPANMIYLVPRPQNAYFIWPNRQKRRKKVGRITSGLELWMAHANDTEYSTWILFWPFCSAYKWVHLFEEEKSSRLSFLGFAQSKGATQPRDIHSRFIVTSKRVRTIQRKIDQQQQQICESYSFWHAVICSRLKLYTMKYYRFWENENKKKQKQRKACVVICQRSLQIFQMYSVDKFPTHQTFNWQRLMMKQAFDSIWFNCYLLFPLHDCTCFTLFMKHLYSLPFAAKFCALQLRNAKHE